MKTRETYNRAYRSLRKGQSTTEIKFYLRNTLDEKDIKAIENAGISFFNRNHTTTTIFALSGIFDLIKRPLQLRFRIELEKLKEYPNQGRMDTMLMQVHATKRLVPKRIKRRLSVLRERKNLRERKK